MFCFFLFYGYFSFTWGHLDLCLKGKTGSFFWGLIGTWVDVCPIENGRCSIAILLYGRVFILRTCTFFKLILLIRNLCHHERNHKSWVSAFMQQHNKGTTRIVIPIIFLSCTFQVMVNWWFGFVVWLSRIPLRKGLLLRGNPDSNPQPTGPPNHQPKPLVEGCFSDLAFFSRIYGRKNPTPTSRYHWCKKASLLARKPCFWNWMSHMAAVQYDTTSIM